MLLLGMAIIQAYAFGQINKIASVPVAVENNIASYPGIRSFSWMAEDWQKDRLYVSYSRGIQVVDTKSLSLVETIPISRPPCGMCLDKVNGRIVTPIQKYISLDSEISFIVTDLQTKTSQFVKVANAGEVMPTWVNVCAFSTDGKTLYLGDQLQDYSGSPKLTAVDTET